MTENRIDLNDAMPCPTCAALVLRDDVGEHQKWHAANEPVSREPDTGSAQADAAPGATTA
jgi:hypothetical protein